MFVRFSRALALVMFCALPLRADTFTLVGTGGNWSTTAIWQQNGVGASRTPGSLPGTIDIVNLTRASYTVTVDLDLAEDIELHTTCPSNTSTCVVDVIAGGVLDIGALSGIGMDARLRLNGGTLSVNAASLDFGLGSHFDWSAGTLKGAGTTNLAFDLTSPAQLHLTGASAKSLDGTTLTIHGKAEYTGSAFSIDNAGELAITSNGVFDIQAINSIATNNAATAKITNAGTFQKTNGAFGSNVDVPVWNSGTIKALFNTLVLGGAPQHTDGTIVVGAGAGLELAGAHVFNGTGNVIQNAGTLSITGTPSIATGAKITADNFTMAGGWLQGPGTIDISGTVSFNGGVFMSGLTANLLSGALLDFNGVAAAFVDNAHVVVNSGATIHLTAGGGLGINNGGHITNGGTFKLFGDASITSDQVASPHIDNNGAFEKSSGAGTSAIGVPFNNSGTVTSVSGNVKLLADGTHSGTFTMCAGCTLEFASGAHGLPGTTIGPATSFFTLTNADLFIGVAGATINAPMTQTGGEITATGTLTINAPLSWTGGIWSDSIGQTILGNFAHTFAPAAPMEIVGRKITNNGTIVYNPTSIHRLTLKTGAQIVNSNVFEIAGDFDVLAGGTATSTLENRSGATLKKSAGAGTSRIKTQVINDGTINILSGTLALNGGGNTTAASTITLNANTLAFETGMFTFDMGGTMNAPSGTLRVSGPAWLFCGFGVTMSVANFQLSDTARVTEGVISVLTGGTWSGGTIESSSNIDIGAGATFDITSATGMPILDDSTLGGAGTIRFNLASMALNGTSSIFPHTGGVVDIQTDTNFTSDGFTASFSIGTNGLLKKSGGTGGARLDANLTMTVASATVRVEAGTLIFNGGNTIVSNGTLEATNADNFIDVFNSGVLTLSGGTFAGSGALRVTGGTLNATANLTLPRVEVQSGTLSVAASKTLQISNFLWNGGSLDGSGTVRLIGTGTIAPSTLTTLRGATTLTNAATLHYNADTVNFLTLTDGSNLNNESGSTFNINNDSIIGGTASDSLTNMGTLLKVGGAGATDIHVPVTSSLGTIGATSGTLRLKNGGTLSSAMQTGTSSTVEFFAGTTTINGSASIAGTGTVAITGGTTNIDAGITIPTLLLAGGTLGGSATFDVHGGSWTGGTMSGSGTTHIPAGKTFDISGTGAMTLARALTNDGTLNFTSGPVALTFNGATLTNNSLTANQTDTTFTSGPGASLIKNTGTLQFTAHASWGVPLENDGSVDVQSGGSLCSCNGGTHSGTFVTATVGTVSFGGATQTFTAASTISGTGSVIFDASTATVAGSLALTGNAQLWISSGATTFTGPTVSIPSLEMNGGTLGGTAAVSINGTFPSRWRGGTITGSGAFTIGSAATFTLDGVEASMLLDGRTLTNDGTVHFTSPTNTLGLVNGAAIDNNATFDIQTDADIVAGAGTTLIRTDGTFSKSAGSGTTNIHPTFTNAGDATFSTGTVSFDGGYEQTAGTTRLGGGNIATPLVVNLNGGTLYGSGTITGNVNNAATVSPGTSPGAITITGDYTQSATGTLGIELAGPTPATQYDQLAIGGTATLDGTLDVTLTYTPTGGETYDVMTFAASSGDFATKNLPTFPAGGSIEATYFPTKLQLAAVVTQADVAVSQTTSGAALHDDTVTFTVTVTNNGPSTADNVTLTDTFTNATFVSAVPTTGNCNGTTPIVCSLGSIAAANSVSVVVTLQATSVGVINNQASVTTSTFDPNNTNDGPDTAAITVSPKAELATSITDSPDPASALGAVTYTVKIVNNGPDDAINANVALSIINGTIDDAFCSTFLCNGANCTAATLPPGTYFITVETTAGTQGTMSLTANASSSTADPNAGDNSATEGTLITSVADVSITKSGPATAIAGDTITYAIKVKNHGPSDATDVVVSDPGHPRLTFLGNDGACTTAFPCNLGTLLVGETKAINATYRIDLGSEGREITNTVSVSTTTFDSNASNNAASSTTLIGCTNTAPSALSPANGAVVPATGTLSWTAGGGTSTNVYLGPVGSGCASLFATTTNTSIAYSLEPGTAYEWRVENLLGGCDPVASACVKFTTEAAACVVPAAPVARVVGQTTTDKTYLVEWDPVPGAVFYTLEESHTADFATLTQTKTVNGLSASFLYPVTAPTAFWYRVRAHNDCGEVSAFSIPVRVVVIPLPPKDEPSQNVSIPAGSTEKVVQEIFLPGEPNQTLLFTAGTDRPWLTVRPTSGVLPPEGVTLEVIADPATLPNGTFTATLIVSTTNPAQGATTHANSTTSIPLSFNLVTPVSPVPSKDATSPYAMIIPSVGHLDGINSQWQSDVRVTNAGFRSTRYRLTFTPAGGTAQGVKQTVITVDAGATTALDDIIRNWYGIGALGESAAGMLEILPLDDAEVTSATTVASSRTYNVTANGTLGQFVPAVRFAKFVGKALEGARPQILSLQQIAESEAYRTNVGIAEAAGAPASVLLTVFNSAGTRLKDIPLQLNAGEQRQLNSVLAVNGITLDDARIEVQVIGGSGKVTAYASVVDNKTRDPLLVDGVALTDSVASKWVLPGVANLDNAVAHWRTDMRVFNYGAAPQAATLTFFPFAGAAPKNASVTLEPGAVMTLNNVVRNLFGSENAGGVIHLATQAASSLVVSGRTYNETPGGTFGQFVPAVTTDRATGAGGRTLHILQVEDSPRFRTNLGIAEVDGKPATIEVQVILPDSKFTPTVTIPLAANEFRQFAIIREMGIGNVYNARITVRVIAGEGGVTAYGSVIDEETQDPMYVPAQ